jgi:hypothetical protein
VKSVAEAETAREPIVQRQRRRTAIALAVILLIAVVIVVAIALHGATSSQPAGPAFSITNMSTGAGGTPKNAMETYQITLANHATDTVRLRWVELGYRLQPAMHYVSGQSNVWAISHSGRFTLLARSTSSRIPVNRSIPASTGLQVQGTMHFSSFLLTKKAVVHALPSITGIRVRFAQGGKTTTLTVDAS